MNQQALDEFAFAIARKQALSRRDREKESMRIYRGKERGRWLWYVRSEEEGEPPNATNIKLTGVYPYPNIPEEPFE